MIKSQDDLPTCNEGKRKSDVLLASIDELEKIKKENEELKGVINVFLWLSIIASICMILAFWEK